MSFVTLFVELVVVLAVIFVLLVPSVAATAFVRSALWVGGTLNRLRTRAVGSRWWRLTYPESSLLIVAAFGMLLWEVQDEFDSPVVIIGTVFAAVGVTVSIINWLSNIFAPPLSQGHFDLAMDRQTNVIEEGNREVVRAVRAVEDGNDRVVEALSELSEEIRKFLEERSGSVGSFPSGDVDN